MFSARKCTHRLHFALLLALVVSCNEGRFAAANGQGTPKEGSDAAGQPGPDGSSAANADSTAEVGGMGPGGTGPDGTGPAGVLPSDIFESANRPTNTGSDDCVTGDLIKLKLPPEIQGCMDQGRIYSFKSSQCLEARQASFACQFDVLAQHVADIGVPNRTIVSARAANAYLVACGEKNGGNTIVAQWYYPAAGADKCSDQNATTKIVTACYKQYGLAPLPDISTKEAFDREQLKCLLE